MTTATAIGDRIRKIQDIIGTDAGDRGIKPLIVRGDLEKAAGLLAGVSSANSTSTSSSTGLVVVLSGFPCCVDHDPPTETDGPPGSCAIARAAVALGHRVVVVTDDCNKQVFQAAIDNLALPSSPTDAENLSSMLSLETFPSQPSRDDLERLEQLSKECQLLVACERAGPGKDGNCYTMRGIDMTSRGLIAPLHDLVTLCRRRQNETSTTTDFTEDSSSLTARTTTPFVAIGDGGNELGMGKVIDKIVTSSKIRHGDKIGCVVAADHLITGSVSNWGGYALAACAALSRARQEQQQQQVDQKIDDDKKATVDSPSSSSSAVNEALVSEWVSRCLPKEEEEIELLNRCVEAGCRDGVSGKMEPTVDGLPLQISLQCLRDIREAALSPAS